MAERRKFTEYEKMSIYARYNGKCAICGKPVMFSKMTVDHIKPISQGGTNDFGNLQLACHSCNRLKNNFMEDEFYAMISDILWNRKFKRMKKMFGGAEL